MLFKRTSIFNKTHAATQTKTQTFSAKDIEF
jgi:hypothetical protein